MRLLFLGLVGLAIFGPDLHTAESHEKTTKTGVERSVVIPEDNTPFKVEMRDTVRLTSP
jgi:hypothetical protein